MTDTRVLWVTEHWPPQRGGMAVSADRIVSSLRRAGATIDVVHLSARPCASWSRTRQLGGELFTAALDADPEHALARLHAQLAASPAGRWTHVVAFGGVLPVLAAPVLAATADAPLVLLLRGNDIDTGVLSLRRRPALHDAVTRAAHVCTVSSDKATLIGRLWPGVEVSTVPNGIDLERWQATPTDRRRAQAWREGAVADGALVLALAGQLKQKKGAALLLDAVRHSPYAEQIHLLLVGDLEPAIADRLAGDVPRHTVLPYVDRYHLLGLLPAADYACLPSFYDGMPNALLEGAGLGLPFVAAAVGGMADILRDGEHGFLFPPGDADGLREALGRAVRATPAERAELGVRARALAAEHTTEREAGTYLDILDKTREPHR